MIGSMRKTSADACACTLACTLAACTHDDDAGSANSSDAAALYGFESDAIDHKAWRTGNSDTPKEFAAHLANCQNHRAHD